MLTWYYENFFCSLFYFLTYIYIVMGKKKKKKMMLDISIFSSPKKWFWDWCLSVVLAVLYSLSDWTDIHQIWCVSIFWSYLENCFLKSKMEFANNLIEMFVFICVYIYLKFIILVGLLYSTKYFYTKHFETANVCK